MPQDKKKNNTRQSGKQQKGSNMSNSNHYFETADELGKRDQVGKMPKRNQATQNPEKPQQ